MCQITQLSPTRLSVITLGQLSHVPLIRSPSELLDGLEPHGLILPGVLTARVDDDGGGGGGVYPGWCSQGGTRRVLYRVLPPSWI